MPKRIFYLDGQFIPIEENLLDVFTPGKNQLQGVFETMLCLDGQVEYLEAHLKRLIKGLSVLKIKHSYTEKSLTRVIGQLVAQNPGIYLGRLRLMVFRVASSLHCLAMVVPYEPFSKTKYAKGLKLCVLETHRSATKRYADVKSLDYAIFARAYAEARTQGFDDALLLNAQGHVFEATRANVFIKFKNQFITPPLSSGCLNGNIRLQMLQLARRLNIKVLEKNITVAMLKKAQAIYLTNSLVGMIKGY